MVMLLWQMIGRRVNNYDGKFQVESIYCLGDIGWGSSRSSRPPSGCEVLKKLRLGGLLGKSFPSITFIVSYFIIEYYIIV